MATYPVVNKLTGEQKEVTMSVTEWDQWKVDNPDWTRDWSDPSTCPSAGELGEVYDRLKKSHPGWNDVLTKASKAPGSKVKPIKFLYGKKKKGRTTNWCWNDCEANET